MLRVFSKISPLWFGIYGTIFSVSASNFLTWIAMLIMDLDYSMTTAIVATVIPASVAPPGFWIMGKSIATIRRMNIELKEAYEKLQRQSRIDYLTGILNRMSFDEYASYLHANQEKGCVMIADADCFKQINDSFGHEAGDRALKLLANTIKNSVREQDIVGRLGGEEFCIYCPGVSVSEATRIAQSICDNVRCQEFNATETKIHKLTISIGGAIGTPSDTLSSLASYADKLMYEAKISGRDRCVVKPVSVRLKERQLV